MRNIIIGLIAGSIITFGIGYAFNETVIDTHKLEVIK